MQLLNGNRNAWISCLWPFYTRNTDIWEGKKKKKALSTALVQQTPKVCRQTTKAVSEGFCFWGGSVSVVLAGLDCFVAVIWGGRGGVWFGFFLGHYSFERSGEYICAGPCIRGQPLQAYAQPQLASTHTNLMARPRPWLLTSAYRPLFSS